MGDNRNDNNDTTDPPLVRHLRFTESPTQIAAPLAHPDYTTLLDAIASPQHADASISSLASRMHRKRVHLTKQWQSVDAEELDNHFVKEYYFQAHSRKYVPFIAQLILIAVVGLVCGSFYWVLRYTTNLLHTLRFILIRRVMDSYWLVWVVIFVWMLVFSLLGVLFIIWEPAAAGSGMPEVIAYLNGLEILNYMSVRTMVCKALGMFLITSSGLYSGYDGPLIHVCVIFSMVLIRNAKKVPTIARWLYDDHSSDKTAIRSIVRINRTNRLRLFAALGASAGISSAFQVPLAGCAFIIEEAISFYDPSLIFKSLFAGSMALLGYSLFYLGTYRNGSDYSIYAINTVCNTALNPLDYLFYVVLGLLGGIFGHLYNTLLAWIRMHRTKFIQHHTARSKVLEIVVIVIVTSLVVSFTFYGPTFSSFSDPVRTPLDRALLHIAKIEPSELCSRPCKDWVLDTSEFLVGECKNYLNSAVCVDTELHNTLGTFIRSRKAAIVQECIETESTNDPTPRSLLPLVADIPGISNESGAKLRLPDSIYLGTVLNKDNRDAKPSPSAKSDSIDYFQMPSLLLNQPEQQIINLFLRGYFYVFQADVLAYFAFTYLLLSLATHHISMPTDMIIPTLVIGSSFGRLFGVGINYLHVEIGTGASLVDPGAFALLGMSAFWAGTSRLLWTIIVIALQSTGDMTYMPGITIVVMLATFVGNMFGPSIFHAEIEAMKLPFLPHDSPDGFKLMSVANLIEIIPDYKSRHLHVIELSHAFTVEEAIHLLKSSSSYNGYPVVETNGRLIGLILRSQLRRILVSQAPQISEWISNRPTYTQNGANKAHPAEDSVRLPLVIPDSPSYHTTSTPINSAPGPEMDRETLDISLKDLVAGQLNQSPHSVHPETSASKAYQLFRSLGLRHLLVVSKTNKVVGILTRTDFASVMHILHKTKYADIPTLFNKPGRRPQFPSRHSSRSVTSQGSVIQTSFGPESSYVPDPPVITPSPLVDHISPLRAVPSRILDEIRYDSNSVTSPSISPHSNHRRNSLLDQALMRNHSTSRPPSSRRTPTITSVDFTSPTSYHHLPLLLIPREHHGSMKRRRKSLPSPGRSNSVVSGMIGTPSPGLDGSSTGPSNTNHSIVSVASSPSVANDEDQRKHV